MDKDTESAVRRFLALIENDYEIERAILYGSRARGTHGPESDADVAVILKGEPQRFLSTMLDMVDPAYDVFLDTGIDISPLPIWLEEWARPDDYPNPGLLKNIDAEGIRL